VYVCHLCAMPFSSMPYSGPTIQFILRQHMTLSDVTADFDVDCSAVLFDGSQVLFTQRSARAFVTGVNHVRLLLFACFILNTYGPLQLDLKYISWAFAI
jgi:hypothetical protein